MAAYNYLLNKALASHTKFYFKRNKKMKHMMIWQIFVCQRQPYAGYSALKDSISGSDFDWELEIMLHESK